MTPKLKNRLALLAKGAVTLILLAVSLRLVRFDLLTEHLRDLRWAPLAASALLLVLGGFAGAGSWFCILRLRLPGLTFREAAACHWSGMFFNSFLPSNVGGDVVKGYIVARGRGQAGFVVTSLLLDRALNLGILCLIGLFALLLRLGRPGWAAGLLAVVGLALAAVPAVARRLLAALRRRMAREDGQGRPSLPREEAGATGLAGRDKRPRLSERAGTPLMREDGQGRPSLPQREAGTACLAQRGCALRGRLALLLEPAFDWAAEPHRFAHTLLAALASQLLKVWHNVFVLRALGIDLPALCVWYVVPLFGLISALPVSIGGLGLRETVAGRIAASLGSDSTHLVLFSLAGYVMVVLVNMLGALPFLFAKGARREEKKH